MKRFVKESGHADTYEGLEIDYVRGKPPTLIMMDGDAEVERVDLAPYSTDELHALMQEKGFARKEAEPAGTREQVLHRAPRSAQADAVADAETTL